MQADHGLDMIRFGVHSTLGLVIYCASADCPIWRVRVLELDTLPELTSMARRHIGEHHTATEPVPVAPDDPPCAQVTGCDQGYHGGGCPYWVVPRQLAVVSVPIHPGGTEGCALCAMPATITLSDMGLMAAVPVRSTPIDSETTDRDRGFSRDRAGRTPRPVPYPSPRDAG